MTEPMESSTSSPARSNQPPTIEMSTPTRTPTRKRNFSAHRGGTSPTRATPIMPGRSILTNSLSKTLRKSLGKAVGDKLGQALGKLAGRSSVGKSLVERLATPRSKSRGAGGSATSAAASSSSWHEQPPPPAEAPPTIDHIIPVMLVGPKGAGKTSLVQSWVERIEPGSQNPEDEPLEDDEDDFWCMDYHKKDFAFNGSDNKKHSVRVQLWDCFGMGPEIPDEEDDGCEDWKKVVQTVDTLLLTVAVNDEERWDQVENWTAWLEEKLADLEKPPTIQLIFTQADRLTKPAGLLEEKLAKMCQRCKIPSWHIVTSRYGDIPQDVESLDDFFCSLVEQQVRSSVFDKEPVEDVDDDKEEEAPSTPPAKRRRMAEPEEVETKDDSEKEETDKQEDEKPAATENKEKREVESAGEEDKKPVASEEADNEKEEEKPGIPEDEDKEAKESVEDKSSAAEKEEKQAKQSVGEEEEQVGAEEDTEKREVVGEEEEEDDEDEEEEAEETPGVGSPGSAAAKSPNRRSKRGKKATKRAAKKAARKAKKEAQETS